MRRRPPCSTRTSSRIAVSVSPSRPLPLNHKTRCDANGANIKTKENHKRLFFKSRNFMADYILIGYTFGIIKYFATLGGGFCSLFLTFIFVSSADFTYQIQFRLSFTRLHLVRIQQIHYIFSCDFKSDRIHLMRKKERRRTVGDTTRDRRCWC